HSPTPSLYVLCPPSPVLFVFLRRPPLVTLFPYTTLFRSRWVRRSSSATCTSSIWGTDSIPPRRSPSVSASLRPGSLPASGRPLRDRKSTRLYSSHEWISYAVFCLNKKRISS